MCHIGLVAGWDGDKVDITALRGWNIQQLLGLAFSEKKSLFTEKKFTLFNRVSQNP